MTWSTNQLKSTLTLSCRHPQLSLVGFRWRRKHRCHAGAYRWTHRHTVTRSACRPRSASNSSTSRYEREKRKYHPTASRMTSGSNCRHLNRPQTEDARRSIQPAYHRVTAKLQHFPPGSGGAQWANSAAFELRKKNYHENYTGSSRHVRRARGANHENNHDITFEAACRIVGALYSQQKDIWTDGLCQLSRD